ncbi:DHA1 family bicyclomycin/chloramphenicol resistance-like MFS transporter [Variovorax sp. Sphag1AA]|nr:DHA1 family bicyclomycin/chloramphenicol resistance-like MFS transporter [Variovorax sp. Sphag1AA]
MSFFLALGAGQLIVGPLSDRFGRKAPLCVGLAVFSVASFGCALAPTIGVLIALRFVQGLGACAAMVIPRAVVRDLHSGPEAARLMALLLTVYSVSPILAPLAGSAVAAAAGWRSVFVAVGALALLAIFMVSRLLQETRSPAARNPAGMRGAFAGYRTLLADRHFVGIALVASLAVGSFFIYVANSAFVFASHYGVGPQRYALLFSLNAVSLVFVSQLNGPLSAKLGLRRTLRWAAALQMAVLLSLLAAQVAGLDQLWLLVLLLMGGFGLNGLIVPSAFVLAMDQHASRAGSASALIGTLNFAGGAVLMSLVAPFADGSPLPMIAGIAACAVGVAVLAATALRKLEA